MPSALGLVHDSALTFETDCGPKKLDGDANSLESALRTKTLPNTVSIDEVVEQLKVNGGVIIKQAVALEDLDIIERDLRPHLNNDKAWEGDFFPRETRRCMGLLGKSPTCAEKVIMHPLYQAVCNKFLTTKNWFWSGHEKISAESKPQIMNTVAFSIGPGAKAQGLHRDDWAHHVIANNVESYPEDLQRDSGVGFFVAAKKATIENGATRYIPGSHLWGHSQEPNDDLCEYAVMEPGDAFIMFASCYHGGGANTTSNEERLLFSCFMTRGWLRQEENQYLSVPQATMRELPVETQKVAGYSISEPFLGWVEGADPRAVLDRSVLGNLDMFKKTEDVESV